MVTMQAGVSDESLRSISTPDRVETRLGTLEFDDGAPSDRTAALVYDHLDFSHAVEAYLGALPGVSLEAHPPWVRFDRGRRRRVRPVSTPDGLGLAVPHRELRHDLLLGLHRPVGRTEGHRHPGPRRADRDPRHRRRHVVPLADRCRPARSRPRAGWALPVRRTGVRRSRCPTAASSCRIRHESDHPDRPGVPGRQRSGAGARSDPLGRPDLLVCPRLHRHRGGLVPRRSITPRPGRRPPPRRGSSTRRACPSTRSRRTTSRSGSSPTT